MQGSKACPVPMFPVHMAKVVFEADNESDFSRPKPRGGGVTPSSLVRHYAGFTMLFKSWAW